MARLALVTGLLGLAAVGSLSAQSNPMRPGNWEVTAQMSMGGQPMPPMTSARCITAEDLKQSEKNGLPGGGPGGPQGNCSVSDYKVAGSNVSWKMACTGQIAMTGEAQMQFKGDAYTGTMTMTMAQGSMVMSMTGKRLGDCAK